MIEMEDKAGNVSLTLNSSIATVSFYHPKANCLTLALLNKLATVLTDLSLNKKIKVVVLQSLGDKIFCAGGSVEEIKALKSDIQAKEFFGGFVRVILAIRNCPCFVIVRVQGKAVGGGVGIVAAADYALASKESAIRLSELSIGIGPFVVSAAIERKIGLGAFSALTVDTKWRDAQWAKDRGLYAEVFLDAKELDQGVLELAAQLATYEIRAMKAIKSMFWEGTDRWPELLNRRLETITQLFNAL